ncbi:unnamed protein product (macronuclear) [Paramecium tetraurelia]|uniref:Transmembrane protein n=1 Tax=Paramecium tetraurelia TaxID=5888 RepID=A0BDP2_PARTE|nr:uncharacterized protein GSPATT00027689001 [Paramecium tetraurelia]CAK56659.1 unnamed protein product [Paramecium tetraurelia]|eukprot:XP_001424057.1 hypothetical protein (macronuclear) [Paramecium tetraurelia strain d4-2]
MNIWEIDLCGKSIANSVSFIEIFAYYPDMINELQGLFVILILFLFNNIQFMQLLSLNSNSNIQIEEIQTDKKYQEDTKQLLQMKVQDFHKKMQKERNENLFKKKRSMAAQPPILQDDQPYPYVLDENDFEDEETYHMNNFEEIQKELEAFYSYQI